ncbi:hypothetical protein ACU686_22810 [Yinghuangia aomiensis]
MAGQRGVRGLAQAPRAGGKLCSPGQVKANVHKPLETIAMRALGHEVKHQAPFEAPEDVVAALAAIPPILPPEPEPPVSAAGADFDDEYTPTAVLSPHGGFTSGPPPAVRRPVPAGPPPALGGGFGGAVKVIVSLVVLVAVVLATWQIAVHFSAQKDEDPKPSPSGSPSAPQAPAAPQKPTALNIAGAKELNVDKNGSAANAQNTADVDKSFDGDPTTQFWRTSSFYDGPPMKLRDGLGIVYDLGSEQELRTAHVKLMAGGNPHRSRAARGAGRRRGLPVVAVRVHHPAEAEDLGRGPGLHARPAGQGALRPGLDHRDAAPHEQQGHRRLRTRLPGQHRGSLVHQLTGSPGGRRGMPG